MCLECGLKHRPTPIGATIDGRCYLFPFSVIDRWRNTKLLIEKILEDQRRRPRIDNPGGPHIAALRLRDGGLRFIARQSFVDEVHGEGEFAPETCRKRIHFLRLEAHTAIHVERIAQHQIRDATLLHDRGERGPALRFVRIRERRQRRGDTEVVTITEPDAAGAVVDAETTHAPKFGGGDAQAQFHSGMGILPMFRKFNGHDARCRVVTCDPRPASLTFAAMLDPLPKLSPAELARYSRHILLGEIGVEGQQRIAAARVLVVGAGGLGSPAALYLAAAGVGTLGIADFDQVAVHNLQRQLLHDESSVGETKTGSAARRLRATNPYVRVVEHQKGITVENAVERFASYDVIVDGTDNFSSRYLNNDAAFFAQKPLVYGSVFKFEGQVAVFAPAQGGPCYRCLFPEPPPAGSVPGCGEAGVLGALCGVIGSLQALETIKLITKIGEPLIGRVLTYNALTQRFDTLTLPRDPNCPLCGNSPRIHDVRAETGAGARCAIEPAKTLEPESVPLEISVAETHRLLKTNPAHTVLLDVREPYEFDICAIAGARFVPMRQIPQQLDALPRDKHLLVLCHHGSRSMRVTEFLRSRGFPSVTNIAGGIAAWAEEIEPSMPRY